MPSRNQHEAAKLDQIEAEKAQEELRKNQYDMDFEVSGMFTKSGEFQGSRPGYLFRMGDDGVVESAQIRY